MPRYLCRAAPDRYLFDEEMHPLIDSPEGVAATRSYLATIPYSPPDILGKGNDYSYTLPFFMRGKAFSTVITVAGAKLFNKAGSEVAGKYGVYPMPGHVVDGRLVRRPTLMYGNNLVVPTSSPHKALAFAFAMWLTDPDNSAASVGVAGGFSDPYRYHHLHDDHIRRVYTSSALEAVEKELPFTTPAGTGLPGDTEYIGALNDNLWRAGRGEITAREAMQRTAAAWEAITERHGREQQIRYWRAFRSTYPEGTEALGR
ncbi:MAG: extracellular solute-binding protein, partial [Ectothiorhodospiraceae bacterium]|jgi:multiple sugar transport system substrate-binding protein